jgi:hypothetical protein
MKCGLGIDSWLDTSQPDKKQMSNKSKGQRTRNRRATELMHLLEEVPRTHAM